MPAAFFHSFLNIAGGGLQYFAERNLLVAGKVEENMSETVTKMHDGSRRGDVTTSNKLINICKY